MKPRLVIKRALTRKHVRTEKATWTEVSHGWYWYLVVNGVALLQLGTVRDMTPQTLKEGVEYHK